jgi:hypothetical protein
MAAVTTTKTALVSLFKLLSVDTAGEWPADKLRQRAEGGLAKYLEPGQVLPEPEKTLFDQIEAANKEQEDITVTDDTPEAKKKPTAKATAKQRIESRQAVKEAAATASPKPTAPAGKPKPAAVAKPKRAGGWKPGDPPLPFDETRGPGVIRTLVDYLKAASPDKPLTKEAAVAKLKAAFPDRDEAKLTTTVNNQIPSRLRIVRGIHVWSNATGYWIAGDGKTPQKDKIRPTTQPKESQVKNAAKAGSKPAATKTQPGAKPTGKPAAKPAATPVKNGPAGKGGKAVNAKGTVAGKAMAKASAGKKK